MGYLENEDETVDWDLYWADSHISNEIFNKVKRY